MPTINEYIDSLKNDKDNLVSNLETKGITGLTGDETFTELVPEVLNIQTGGDLSEYFASSITAGTNKAPGITKIITKIPSDLAITGTSMQYGFRYFQGTEIPSLDFSGVQRFDYCFENCVNLVSVGNIDTSDAIVLTSMFSGCENLQNLPVFDLSSVTAGSTLSSMFLVGSSLTDTSLDNILQSCISAVNYTGTKTLAEVGLSSVNYSASRIQGLSHYQDFIDAGWSIGY